MKSVALVGVLIGVLMVTGCQTPYIKVTDTKVIKAGQSFTVSAPAKTPGMAMRVQLDLSTLKMDEVVLKKQAKAQGITLPDLGSLLKGNCWLVVNCDTNAPVVQSVKPEVKPAAKPEVKK